MFDNSRNLLKSVSMAVLLLSLFASVVLAAPRDIVVWDFEGETLTPSTDEPGGSTATGGSGLGSESFPAGNGSTDAWSFNNWSTGARDVNDYFEFLVDLSDFGGIDEFSFGERRSGTCIRDFVVYYSTDGSTFTEVPNTTTNVPDNTSWRTQSFDLSSGGTNDIDSSIRGQATVYFRIYGYNAEGVSGTWRIDDVTFHATTGPNAVTLSSLSAHAAAPWTGIALAGLLAGALVLVRRKR